MKLESLNDNKCRVHFNGHVTDYDGDTMTRDNISNLICEIVLDVVSNGYTPIVHPSNCFTLYLDKHILTWLHFLYGGSSIDGKNVNVDNTKQILDKLGGLIWY